MPEPMLCPAHCIALEWGRRTEKGEKNTKNRVTSPSRASEPIRKDAPFWALSSADVSGLVRLSPTFFLVRATSECGNHGAGREQVAKWDREVAIVYKSGCRD